MNRLVRWKTVVVVGLAVALVAVVALVACQATDARPVGVALALGEPFRPQYHMSVPRGWANDPNGLVFFDGEYHLFYQHNPDDTVWGPMHWGHAVSVDLVNWTHLPIALYPDELGTIFSGSAVIDQANTAGFSDAAMVAIFTHNDNGRQMQSVAHSTDKGRSWAKYAGNPVLEPPNNIRNFRDPKVFWYETAETGHWVMVVSAGNAVLFFTSDDLLTWQTSGGFGLTHGATCGVWETPDLFQLAVDGGPETRWVLAVAIGGCAPAGGSGVQYFVGQFDGRTFTNDNAEDTILWVDYGADFYAPQSWSNAPDDRRVWLGWMNNWTYAQDIPTSTWRGSFTVPRELTLVTTPEGVRLAQTPIAELQQLRGQHWQWRDETIGPNNDLLAGVRGETLEIVAEFAIADMADADRFGLRVRVGPDAYTTIGYGVKARTLYVDRTRSGEVAFNPAFPAVHTAALQPVDGRVRLHILIDRASVEVFANDGLVVFSEQVFPSDDSNGLELFVDGEQVQLRALDIWQLAPAAFRLVSVEEPQ